MRSATQSLSALQNQAKFFHTDYGKEGNPVGNVRCHCFLIVWTRKSQSGRSRINRGFDAPNSVAASFQFSITEAATIPMAFPVSETIGEPEMPPLIGCAGFESQSGPSILFIHWIWHPNHPAPRLRRKPRDFSNASVIGNGV